MGSLITELSNGLISSLGFIELLRMGTLSSAVIFSLLTAVVGVAFVYAVYSLFQSILRFAFFRQYRISLNHRIRLIILPSFGKAKYQLRFPRWKYPNVDGSRDRRRKGNAIRKGKGVLHFALYRISSKSPIHIVWLVNALRRKGHQISLTNLEQEKYGIARQRQKEIAESKSIGSIRMMFDKRETDFEKYCAELFRLEGYKAKTTRAVADGGYDIDMIDRSGRRCIAECKCYTSTSIGEPLLRQLNGANELVGAERRIFITTTHFSTGAIQYANATGIELIDGHALLSLAEKHRQAIRLKAEEPPIDDWLCDYDDIAACYPPDRQPNEIVL